jgi:hypothetical protein
MSYSWFQTSQTGGQQYSDTSLFSILWSSVLPTVLLPLANLILSFQSGKIIF